MSGRGRFGSEGDKIWNALLQRELRWRRAVCHSRSSFRHALRPYLAVCLRRRAMESGPQGKLDRAIMRLRHWDGHPPGRNCFPHTVRKMQKIFRKTFPDGYTALRQLTEFGETDGEAWQPAVRTISLAGRRVRLSVTPAWQILGPFPPEKNGNGGAGPRLGISPAHDDSLHLVNGWLAAIEGDGMAPLRLVRHGHLRNWPRIRLEGDAAPAVGELLSLAVRCQEKLWEDLLERAARGEDAAVPVRLASVQLMTPGAREWFCDGSRPNEQRQVWEKAKEVAIAVAPHPAAPPVPIRLLPEVLAFDFPVNPWFHRLGGVRLLGKQPIPENFFPANDRALRTLLGDGCAGGEEGPDLWRLPEALRGDWEIVRAGKEMDAEILAAAQNLWGPCSLVGAALHGRNHTERELWQVIQLARQVLELCRVTAAARWRPGWKRRKLRAYEDFAHVRNPYAMPARVLVLCHLLGLPCACNCRSGKDRTGIFHGEVAYLWLRLQGGGRGTVPEPYVAKAGPSPQERYERARILNACGSDHILFSCTGFHGYRVLDDRRWLRALLRFPFLKNLYGPTVGASWLAEC